MKRIVLTGPESTGKTTLTLQLSNYYNTNYHLEFAREYIERINRKYTYDDIIIIAQNQIDIFNNVENDNKKNIVFFDTGLIITKVWFQEVYNKVPEFLNKAIETIRIDLYLLCYPDIKWVADNVRENGGKKRINLFYKYKEELEKNKSNYFIISGNEDARLLSAKKYLSSAYCL